MTQEYIGFEDYRCRKCRRLMGKFGTQEDSFGLVLTKCRKCKFINNILYFEGKIYLINDKLKKKRKLLKRFVNIAKVLDPSVLKFAPINAILDSN